MIDKGATGEFSDSITYEGKIDHQTIGSIFSPPTHLLIVMGDNKPSDELRRMYPTIQTIVIDVRGRRYEFDADMVLALLDWWKEQHE